MDGRILLGKVDCTKEADLCRRCLFSLCFWTNMLNSQVLTL